MSESLQTSPSAPPNQVDQLAPIYGAARLVLNWGFRLGAAILATGLVVALVKSEPLKPKAESFSKILPAVFDGKANGVVDLAILTLMATPVVTVLSIAIGFFRIGDRRYGLISLIVLAVLVTSISLSLFR